MKTLDKIISWYFKNEIAIMKAICSNFVDNLLNTLEQYDNYQNKEMKLIEIYFFILTFISHIFFSKRPNTYKNNKIFDLFLGEIFIELCLIYNIDKIKFKKAANEFIINYRDRNKIYIASLISDLYKNHTLYSETIFEFMLHLYDEIGSDELNKIRIPIALQLSALIAECSDCL